MNSTTIDMLTAPYRLRSIRDFDLDAFTHLFPESASHGATVSDWRAWLRDVENIAWGRNPKVRLVMEEISTGRSIAGFTFERRSEATAVLHYGFRPSTAMTQIAGFVLARDFAFRDLQLIALRTEMVSGQDPLAQIHDGVGYRQAVRLREFWRDPDDTPRDLITYEAVNPAWEGRS
jgi:hypothetical protein